MALGCSTRCSPLVHPLPEIFSRHRERVRYHRQSRWLEFRSRSKRLFGFLHKVIAKPLDPSESFARRATTSWPGALALGCGSKKFTKAESLVQTRDSSASPGYCTRLSALKHLRNHNPGRVPWAKVSCPFRAQACPTLSAAKCKTAV